MAENNKNEEVFNEQDENINEANEVLEEEILEAEKVEEETEENLDAKDSRIKELEEEVAKWKDGYIRKVAEFENFRKRKEKEITDFRKYASEKVILKVLESVDNLERAISSSSNNKDFDSLVKGVEMTLNLMHKTLQEEGVEPLETLGKEFNPYEHHAMMQEETDEHEHNTVCLELQKGYKMKDKVIRPALVKVAKKIEK